MSTSTTTTDNMSTLPSPPASPSTTTSTPPSPSHARKQRPKLTLNPTARASISEHYYDSPRSCFSPDSSDDEAESDDEPEKSAPLGSSYFKRSWAFNRPPSTPPSGPLPATPMRPPPPMRRPSCLSSVADCVYSPGPNTPASAPASRGMPRAPTAPPTPYSPWGRAPTQPSVDTALFDLESRLKTVLGSRAPEELVVARKERDVLIVRLQKAYYRGQEIGGLQGEWASAGMRVKALEDRWLMEVLSGVEAMVWSIRDETAPYVQQEQSEEEDDDECAVESEEEDEDILDVLEHTVVEHEAESPQVPSHEERRFVWLSKPAADSEDGSYGSEAESDVYSSEAESDNHDSKALCCSFGFSVKYCNNDPKAICYDNNNNGDNFGAKHCDYSDSKAKYDSHDSRPKYHNNNNNNNSDHLAVPALFHNDSASSSEASSSPIIPGGNDVWAPFSASDGSKPAGVVVLRIADVEMEMI